jgi:hypothetical protein
LPAISIRGWLRASDAGDEGGDRSRIAGVLLAAGATAQPLVPAMPATGPIEGMVEAVREWMDLTAREFPPIVRDHTYQCFAAGMGLLPVETQDRILRARSIQAGLDAGRRRSGCWTYTTRPPSAAAGVTIGRDMVLPMSSDPAGGVLDRRRWSPGA